MKSILLLLAALALLLGGVGQAKAGMFTFTGNIQQTTLAPGTYEITVAGAQGGNVIFGPGEIGGDGAVLRGEITLTATTTLQIVVCGQGAGSQAGGGGGGSFVY